ncbi:hypothetical protein [Psychrobium sp. 1_MG-2023]|uniref:hypothetical protein n=1 Tax=Psychrobium sp. 1_MG-2023 TaxID=3062624 RepID=UPI000C31F29F|nr:hypothetical protein [Psychrobium sp. 1_MG-2023]MDP2562134.1 hypothetical protein [Psychrobium sp. 1_MG-2023]PKF57189.1 hypothetical protein CW748_07330 [Alteromonadales bacterium alter-6D02]
MNSYKYFLIYDRNKHIIYGECINWRCGEFDSNKSRDVTISLNKKYKARFIVSDKRIDLTNPEQRKVLICKDISLHYADEYNDFITRRSDEVMFSPLIDRCSKLKMFVGHEMASNTYQCWVDEHKKLLEEIKIKFGLDLLSRPELINTYTYYEPTRIVVNCRFIDRPAPDEKRLPTKLKVKFYDEFYAHTKASYILFGYFEDREPQVKEGKISEGEVIVNFDESPDEVEVKVIDQGETIYNSRHGFLRSIKVQGKVIGDTVTLENGSKVAKYSELNVNVGE